MVVVDFPWKSCVQQMAIQDQPKIFGRYKRGNKTFFRNYNRELKNGKGLSIVDIVTITIIQAEKAVIDCLRIPVYERILKSW